MLAELGLFKEQDRARWWEQLGANGKWKGCITEGLMSQRREVESGFN
jgi:hypothetical protein